MSKKKKPSLRQQPLSPKKYVITRARTLPVYKCLLNRDWKESHMASIVVMRKHINGHITAGFYLVDLLALGVKDTHFKFNEPEWTLEEEIFESVPEDSWQEAPYELVHNIIYGAVAFAEEYDIKPHADFSITQYILEEDTDAIELINVSFGIDGKPAFMSGNYFEDDDFDDDEIDLFDFSKFTDDDWRDYLNSSPELNDEEVVLVMEGIFESWLNRSSFDEKNVNMKFDENITIAYELLESYAYKDEQDRKEATEILQSFEEPLVWKLPALEKRIHQAIDKNPDNPMLYNFLCSSLQLQKKEAEYKDICAVVIRKFPDYVHGKILWINLLIDNDRPDEVPAFLDNHYDLSSVFPARKMFHISEAESFYASLIRYFVRTGQLYQAKIYSDRMFDLMGDERYERGYSNTFQISQREFALEKMKKVVEYVANLGAPAHDFLRDNVPS